MVKVVNVRVIASGGMGHIEDILPPLKAGASAIACADILHYDRATIGTIRSHAHQSGIRVRKTC